MSSRKIDIFAWDNSNVENFRNISQYIVISPRGKTAQQLADFTKSEIERLSPDKITLRMWKEVNIGDIYAFDTSDPINTLKTNGAHEDIWKYWRDYFFYIEKLGIKPDMIIHDLESGYGYWHIRDIEDRELFFRTIFDNIDKLSDVLPDEFTNISYDEFMEDVEIRVQFHRWANERRSTMLKRVFHDILFYIYGEEVPHSNYKDMNLTDGVLDEHNRIMSSESITSISSPVIYFDNRVINRPGIRFSNLEKHPRWNKIIEGVNIIISCLRSGGDVIPWIASPGYGRYGVDTWTTIDHLHSEIMLWDSVMRLMTSMGIYQFILWNPLERFNPHAAKTDTILDSYTAYRRADININPFELSYINDDADEIRIGNTVIKYEDVLNHMG